jgi:hypothetical protein
MGFPERFGGNRPERLAACRRKARARIYPAQRYAL